MLSVVIETRGQADALARTLSSLVAGAVEGAVREVIVCDLAGDEAVMRVADLAGCQCVKEGGTARAIAVARSDWLVFLEPGARMVDGWIDPVADHINAAKRAARFTHAGTRRSMLPGWLRMPGPVLRDGLLIRREEAIALTARAEDAESIARGASAVRLEARIATPGRR